MKISESLKSFDIRQVNYLTLLIFSILLSVPTLVLGNNIVYAIPVLLTILLSLIFGERFIISVILISLFTLVREFNASLRSVIHLVDFTLLGILFLNKYGLKISAYPQIPKSLIYFLVLYSIAFLLSSAMSKYPSAGIEILAKQVAFFIIAYVFYSFIKDEKEMQNYFISIIVVAVIFTTLFVSTFINQGYDLISLFSNSRVRITALTGNIEAATNFYVISFPILISIFLYKKKSMVKAASLLLLLYLVIGLFLAMSRSAILGIVVSTAIIFFMLKRKRFYQFLIFILVLALAFIVIEPLNEIVTQLFRIEEGVSFRDQLWLMAVNIIKDYPVFGLGPGAYRYELYNYFPFMLDDYVGRVFIFFADVSEGVNLAHNIFLVFFSDMGILGLATIIALPVIYFRIGIKTMKKYKNESADKYYFIIALFAAGASVIFRNIFNSIGLLYIGGIHTDLPFWLVFSSLIYFYNTPIANRPNIEDDH